MRLHLDLSKHFAPASRRRRADRSRRRLPECLERRELLSANVLNYHNDLQSTGQNLAETILTPANVNASTFGKIGTIGVDGQVYAQPLYMENVNITAGPNAGAHNTVFVATQHDSLYAIDAQTGAVLWHDSFINPSAGVTTLTSADVGSNDISPELGITSTPVIDPSTNTLYVVANTKETRADGVHYVYRLHAIDIGSGAEKFGGPLVLADTMFDGANFTYVAGPSVAGNGDGSVNGRITLNGLRNLQRAALTLVDGTVYIAFGSHSDEPPVHGWLIGVDPQSLAITAVFNTTPNGNTGTIWQSGNTVTSDAAGNLYVATGNGTFDAQLNANGQPVHGDYGDSVIKLAPDPSTGPGNPGPNGWGLKVVGYFTPSNQQQLDQQNLDLGAGGLMLLPDAAGSAAHPHLLLAIGKQGELYLLNRDNLAGFNPNVDHVVQEQSGVLRGAYDTPAYFNGSFDYANPGDHAKSFSIANAAFSTSPTSVSNDSIGFPGGTISISANGTADGIAWLLDGGSNELRAYDATNFANELYTSDQAAGGRDQVGKVTKFSVPTVADGQVFVGSANSLEIYGLINGSTPSIQGTGAALIGNEFSPLNGVAVATFTNGDGGAAPGAFNASITWGDGTTSQGSVTESGTTYVVSGSHTYQDEGNFPITVNVVGNLASAAIAGAATIHDELLPGITLSTPNQFYVAEAYRDLLGRAVDPGGLAMWSAQLDQGMPRAAFTSALAHSDEYFHNIIQSDYQHYLGRAADPQGLNAWTAQMRNGLTDEQLEAGFISSPEFFAHVGGTNKAWIDALYFDLLGRAAEFAGENLWLQELAQGMTRYSVATFFTAGPEREALRVQADYQRFLGRAASPAEVNGWVTAFRDGMTNENVAAGFAASMEYYQIHSRPR
ncbi:MAG TPA: DUF4214 domain-containing protein [Pirellulales bacterium]|nr:DUF4214 domain-containing protein [Pirellulales bacterium]